jgi:type IX secretion system PorP/SprF family membrane protein
MKKIILSLSLLVSTMVVAQQDPQFTQYFDNQLFVNPAYAGSKGLLNITGLHREQWFGFNGRPRSTTLSIHSPLAYESVGLGLTAVNDEVGPLQQTMFYGDFSYTLKFKNPNNKLAFGLKAGVNMLNSRTAGLNTTDDQDAALQNNVTNRANPNFGVGIYYHTPKWFAGISTPKIIEKSYVPGGTSLEKRHLFFSAGFVKALNRNWKLRPTTQLKFTQGAPISLDLSAAGIYNEKFTIGAMYRLAAAVGAFAQYQITPQFKAGLATDFAVTKLRKANNGTLEIMLSYDFVFKKTGIRSPRYF